MPPWWSELHQASESVWAMEPGCWLEWVEEFAEERFMVYSR
jgi:hypothetical protein